MTRWIRVTTCDNVPLREGRAVLIGDKELALFNLGDRFLATDNRCPHQGGPLCDGIVTGESVVCPLHAWKVNLAHGKVERPAHAKDHCVQTYHTRIDDGVVLIALPEPRRAGSGLATECADPPAPAPATDCADPPKEVAA